MRYLLILSLLFLAGCGGGSSSSASNTRSVVGDWIGTYTTADQSDHGSARLQIGSSGQSSGSLTSDVTGRMASPHGNVNVTSIGLESASLEMSYFWSPGNAQNGGTSSTYGADVFVTVEPSGVMTGTFKQFLLTSSAKAPTLNLSLHRQ
jgi:hypothetical protein